MANLTSGAIAGWPGYPVAVTLSERAATTTYGWTASWRCI
jgi:hypothetical protein